MIIRYHLFLFSDTKFRVLYSGPPLVGTPLPPNLSLERCSLVRGRHSLKAFIHGTCCIILSLSERGPLARVSFKRGTTVLLTSQRPII